MRKHTALLILALTVGCIDVPAVDSIMDKILPDKEIEYQQATLMEADGSFAPESTTNESVLETAVQAFLEEWTIKVSGSGMEGLPGIAYSGTYEIKVKSEILVSG